MLYPLPKSLRMLILLLAGCFLSRSSQAQITTAASYSFQAFSGTYTPLVGGTAFPSGIIGDDVADGPIPIGFTFNFCGIDYTTCSAGSDGWVSLSAPASALSTLRFDYPGSLSFVSTFGPGMLYWSWADLWADPSMSSAVTYATTGPVGSRVFTLEFKNWTWYAQTTPRTPIANVQVKLFEGTNVIQYIYGTNMAPYSYSATSCIGISNGGTDYKGLTSPGTSPTTSSTTFTTWTSPIPVNGQVYQFAPPLPCAGSPQAPSITTNLSAPICSGFNTTLSMFDPNITTGMHYVWQQAPNPTGPWTNIPGAPDATSYATPGLVQTSYYRVGDSCGNSNQVTYSAPVTVLVNTYAIPYAEYFLTTPNTNIPFCFTENVTPSNQSRWAVNTRFHDETGAGYTVMSEEDPGGNFQFGKNAFFTLPALLLNSGETYQIRFSYERGRDSANSTNNGTAYPENLALLVNYAVQPPTGGTGVPGGSAATYLFQQVITTPGRNPASLTYTPRATGAYYFSWYSNTPHPQGGINVAGGIVAVDSIRIDSFGCEVPVIANQPQNSAVCIGNTATLSVNATGYNLTYQWYKNGSAITGANSSILTITNAQASDAAPYKVLVTGTCGGTTTIQSNTVNLIVSPYPTDTITTTTPTAFCAGGSVVLTGNSAAGNNFQWKVNGSLIPNALSATYTALNSGTYQSISTNQYGCSTTSAAVPVTVLSAASVTISPSGPTTFCNGGNVTLVANTATGLTGNTSPITYRWKKDGLDVVPLDTTNVLTVTAAGSYNVTETISNGSGTCSVQFPTPIQVIVNGPTAAPAISAGGPLSFCLGGFVTLSTPNISAPTGQQPYTYQWYRNDTAIASNGGTNTTLTAYTASATGRYSVKVTQNSCPLSSPYDTVLVDAPPTTVANNGTIICSGNTVVLTAAPGQIYQWLNGPDPIPGETNQVFSTNTGGTFAVRVTDAANCVATSSPINVLVGAPPSAVILAAGPTTFCPGGNVRLRANYDPSLAYVWSVSSTGLPGTYTALAPTRPVTDTDATVTQSGFYTVTEANGPCQSTSLPIQVIVSPTPSPSITASGTTSLCPGGSVTLTTQTLPNLTYQWVKDGANINGAINPSLSVSSTSVNAGGSNYKLIATNNFGCTGTTSGVTVQVANNPADSITVQGSDSVCAGNTVTLQAPLGTGYTYQWKMNNVNVSGANQSTYPAGVTGGYTVTVTTPVGCFATTPAPTQIQVLPVPPTNVTTSGSTTFCTGSSVTLNAGTGSGLTYQWQRVTNNLIYSIPGATSSSYVDSLAGNYRVVISNGVCPVASIVTTVAVNTPPVVSATASGGTTFCQGGNVTLTANNLTGATYQWKRSGGNITGATLPTYAATTSGIYTVVASVGNCAATSGTVNVTVNALPNDTVTLATGSHNPTCMGTPAMLVDQDHVAGYTYQWKLNGNLLPNPARYPYPAMDSGLYSFVVTDNNGCSNSSPFVIGSTQVYHLALNALPDPTLIVTGSTISTGTFVSYQWYFNDQPINGATGNSYNMTQAGKYSVTVTDGNGCSSTSGGTYVSNVGVGTVSKTDIRIYPNPVTSVVHIDASIPVNATVSSIDGRKLIESNGAKQIDLSELADGVYMITILDEKGTVLKVDKLVKAN